MIRFINREQLYRDVWTTPATKLAPLYNISTYEMKKLCDNFLVPLPKVGYWSKVLFGKTVKIPSLQVYDKCRLKPRKFNFRKTSPPVTVDKVEKILIPDISVKKNLTMPHAITVKTRDGLKRSQTDDYGMKKPWGGGFDLRVSRANERRALLIIDALSKWFEKNGIKIYQPFKGNTTTEVIIKDQHIRIKIEEKSKLTGKKLDNRWGGNYEYYIREYTPTEQLSLVIDNYCWGCSLRKVWRDGKTSKVEEKLGEFVAALFQHSENGRVRELRLKAEEMEREKRRKLQRYDEACNKLEKEMLADLKRQSRNLMYSKELKIYIDGVKRLANKQYLEDEYPVELIDWIHWAEKYAEELDPLSKSLPGYRKATTIIKLEEMDKQPPWKNKSI